MRLRSIRSRVTYANVTASIALFVALGGTSYALTLPRNSVGTKQLRTGSVGRAEIRTGAVRSPEIRNRSIALKDISAKAQASLRGQSGPTGPPGTPALRYFAEVSPSGAHAIGDVRVMHVREGEYTLGFASSLAGCALVSSPGVVGADVAPAGSTVVVSHDGANAVVHTYGPNDQQADLPFTLIAAC
jgi:hypothetical protein